MSGLGPALGDVWAWYTQTLVYYSHDSWVARAVRTFRILAALLLAPFVFLTLLVCPLALDLHPPSMLMSYA